MEPKGTRSTRTWTEVHNSSARPVISEAVVLFKQQFSLRDFHLLRVYWSHNIHSWHFLTYICNHSIWCIQKCHCAFWLLCCWSLFLLHHQFWSHLASTKISAKRKCSCHTFLLCVLSTCCLSVPIHRFFHFCSFRESSVTHHYLRSLFKWMLVDFTEWCCIGNASISNRQWKRKAVFNTSNIFTSIHLSWSCRSDISVGEMIITIV